MSHSRNFVARSALALTLATGTLLATIPSASAYVVCNRFGDCWHTRHHYRFPMRLRVRFYSDSWHHDHDWDHDRYRHWRGDRNDRGYWRNGVWINF